MPPPTLNSEEPIFYNRRIVCRKSDLAVKRGSLASVATYVDKGNAVLISECSIFGGPTFPNV